MTAGETALTHNTKNSLLQQVKAKNFSLLFFYQMKKGNTKKYHFAPAEVELIKSWRQQGLTWDEIAKKTQCSAPTLRRLAKEFGWFSFGERSYKLLSLSELSEGQRDQYHRLQVGNKDQSIAENYLENVSKFVGRK